MRTSLAHPLVLKTQPFLLLFFCSNFLLHFAFLFLCCILPLLFCCFLFCFVLFMLLFFVFFLKTPRIRFPKGKPVPVDRPFPYPTRPRPSNPAVLCAVQHVPQKTHQTCCLFTFTSISCPSVRPLRWAGGRGRGRGGGAGGRRIGSADHIVHASLRACRRERQSSNKAF